MALRAFFDRRGTRALYTDELTEHATDDWQRTRSADPRSRSSTSCSGSSSTTGSRTTCCSARTRTRWPIRSSSDAPFLDHRLIELAFRMPPRLKVRGLMDKFVERELARKLLPPENVRRSKNPFYFPLEYFRDHPELGELIRLTLDPGPGATPRLFRSVPRCSAWWDQMNPGRIPDLKQVFPWSSWNCGTWCSSTTR